MANKTHTPGPWRASPQPIMGSYCVTRWPDSDEYLNVAEVDRIEDARLIAAAPDLLAALQAARPIVEKWCHTQGDNAAFFADVLGPIDAAIAKATGADNG